MFTKEGKMKLKDIANLSLEKKVQALEAEITKYHSRKLKTWRQWCYFDIPKKIIIIKRNAN
jgi:hypothetical protein